MTGCPKCGRALELGAGDGCSHCGWGYVDEEFDDPEHGRKAMERGECGSCGRKVTEEDMEKRKIYDGVMCEECFRAEMESIDYDIYPMDRTELEFLRRGRKEV